MREPPAAPQPGGVHSAAPGLILFSINLLLLGLLILLSYTWLPLTGPRSSSVGVATATPALFIISGAPNPVATATPAIRPAATAHATATRSTHSSSATPTPTHTPTKPTPTPTATSAPIIGPSPTPTPTISAMTG